MGDFKKYRVDLNGTSFGRVTDPPGYNASVSRQQTDTASQQDLPLHKRQAAIFSQATGCFKQVAMLCFMMYMSGNTLNIFPIMTTLSGVYQPLTAILKSKDGFPTDPSGKLDTLTPRLVFCAIQSLGLLFALNKINSMGLFPTNLADWVSSIRVPTPLERSVTGL